MDDKDSLFKLRWDAQRQALLGSVATLFHEEAFIDTTICTDGKIFKAHRLLLSASSPYLKEVLQSVPGDHAILLLPHIKSQDFQHVLQFIYEGEIKISQKDLKSFLQVSKMLKIKGMDFDDEEAEEFFSSESNNNDSVTSSASAQGANASAGQRQLKRPNSHSPTSVNNRDLVVSSVNNNNNNNEIPNPHRKMGQLQHHSPIDMGRSNKYRRLEHHEPEPVDGDDHDLDDEEDSEFQDGDGLDDGMYSSLLPEVSMEESEEEHYKDEGSGLSPAWGRGLPHSSSGMRTGNGNGDGILLRMMKEPLKSSAGGGGNPMANYHHEIDEAGLNKRSKRYVSCSACSKVLSSLSALKRHMEDVHCARIQGKCLICGRVYSSRNSLLTHVYSAHKKHNDYKAVARIIRESDFETFGTTN